MGHFCPPGSGSGFRSRIWIRYNPEPDTIRIRILNTGFTEEYVFQEPEPESSSSEEDDSTEAEEEEEEEEEESGMVAQNVEAMNENAQNTGVTTVQPPQDMTEEQQNSTKAHQAMNAADKVQRREADAPPVAKTAARQRAELSQRGGKAVAVLCRLCGDILEAGHATAGLYGATPGQYGATAAGQYGVRRQGSTPQEPAEAERVARRGREFDARLARGLYQVPVPYHCGVMSHV